MILSGVQWVVATLIGQMDNREYASIILMGLIAIYLLTKGKLLSVIKSFADVVKCALSPKILIPALILVTYSALLIYGAFEFGFWNTGILLDTILEVVFVGFPSMLIASKATSVTSIKNELIVPEVRFGALASFYINLVCFPIPFEVALQVVLLFLGIGHAQFSSRRDVSNLCLFENMRVVLCIIVCVATTLLLSNAWFSMDWGVELSSLFLSIWYPVFIMPYVLALAYYASLESMAMRIKVSEENLPTKEFIKIAMALLPNFRYIRHFNGWNAHEYLECLNPSEKACYLGTFKREIDTVAANANAKVKRFESGKGSNGFDEDGIWLDWTHLEEMKSFLWTIASLENRSWMESGAYSSLDEAFNCFLPKGCNGSLLLSRGKDTYVCWVINSSGFVFAAGSRDGAFPFMKYEGDRRPITDGADMLSEFVDDSGDADTRLKNWHFSFYVDKSYL
ncbi:hypothetical protein DWY05_02415 [Collinsella sp. AF23-4AC]|nr:hypothetical protein DWY06_00680 [Collinsella sp. AF23-6]RGS24669.1 hypothetical protein DWY05_02415 [Collinsella sp. AF23-4AC]